MKVVHYNLLMAQATNNL